MCRRRSWKSENETMTTDKLPLLAVSPSNGNEFRHIHSVTTTNTKWTTLKAVYFVSVACFGGLGFGLTVSFSSPLLDELTKSNLTQWEEGFSTEECAYQILIGPISPIAAIVGGLLSAPLTAISGLVSGMILTAGVYLSGWTMVGSTYFITSPFAFRGLLLTGRALTGFAMEFSAASAPVSAQNMTITYLTCSATPCCQSFQCGTSECAELEFFYTLKSFFLTPQVYNAEISPTNIRGPLGGFFQMSLNIGMVTSYIIGGLLSYWQASFIFAGISIIHLVLLFTIPESPKRFRNPFKNLQQLTHQESDERDGEQDQMQSNIAATVALTSKFSYIWRVALVVVIMAFQQVTGVNAIVFYAGPILQSTGWNNSVLTANMAAAISVGVIQLVSAFISLFLVDRIGRRLLLFFGSIGLTLSSLGMVVYFVFSYGLISEASSQSNAINNTTGSSCFYNGPTSNDTARDLEVLALVSIGVFNVFFGLSWGPIAFVFAAEILPDKIRTLGNGMGVATNWICASLVTLLFPTFASRVGYAIPFLAFASLSLLSSILLVLFIPETRGLTLQESSALKFSVRRNIKEFISLLKWCFCCQCCTRIMTRHRPI